MRPDTKPTTTAMSMMISYEQPSLPKKKHSPQGKSSPCLTRAPLQRSTKSRHWHQFELQHSWICYRVWKNSQPSGKRQYLPCISLNWTRHGKENHQPPHWKTKWTWRYHGWLKTGSIKTQQTCPPRQNFDSSTLKVPHPRQLIQQNISQYISEF